MATGIPARLSPAEGRKFGLTVGAAFLALTALFVWKDHGTAARIVGSIGGTLFLAGWVIPGKLGPVYRAWMGLALLISKVTTPIFMGIIYFLVFTPVRLIQGVLGRKAMVHAQGDAGFWLVRESGERRGDLERKF